MIRSPLTNEIRPSGTGTQTSIFKKPPQGVPMHSQGWEPLVDSSSKLKIICVFMKPKPTEKKIYDHYKVRYPIRTGRINKRRKWEGKLRREEDKKGRHENNRKSTYSILSGSSVWVMNTQLTKIVTVINELNHVRSCVKEKLSHHASLWHLWLPWPWTIKFIIPS